MERKGKEVKGMGKGTREKKEVPVVVLVLTYK